MTSACAWWRWPGWAAAPMTWTNGARPSPPRGANIRAARRNICSSLPLLGDYLEDGLAMFDEGIVDDADTREGVDGEDEPLGNMTDKPPGSSQISISPVR